MPQRRNINGPQTTKRAIVKTNHCVQQTAAERVIPQIRTAQ